MGFLQEGAKWMGRNVTQQVRASLHELFTGEEVYILEEEVFDAKSTTGIIFKSTNLNKIEEYVSQRKSALNFELYNHRVQWKLVPKVK